MPSVTAQCETLRIVGDHMLVERDGKLCLLDTGVPDTMACPDIVSEMLGVPVHTLVGCRELARSPLTIDWSGRSLRHAATPVHDSIPVRLGTAMFGVPTIRVATPTGEVEAVLDTGASLGYASPDAVKGRKAIRRVEDFLPGLGQFTVDVYRLDVAVGGVPLALEVGILPPLLQMALGLMCRDGWILGAALFRDRIVTLDLASSMIHLAPTTTASRVGSGADDRVSSRG